MAGDGLDHWRSYFKSASSSIFEVIEHGIAVAAKDCPEEFKLRRGRIAEKLYSCQSPGNSAPEDVKLMRPKKENGDLNGEKREGGGDERGVRGNGDGFLAGGGGDTKDDSAVHEHAMTQVVNKSQPTAVTMADENHEIEDVDNEIVMEVLRIKELLNNSENESESVLLDALRGLQLMPISVETLQVTMIGKPVSDLSNRSSRKICQLARKLIQGWQLMIDEWHSATPGSATDSNTFSLDETELTSLPLNDLEFPSIPWNEKEMCFLPMSEADLLSNRVSSANYLETFFDGLDDNGNPIEDFDKQNRRPSSSRNHNKCKPRSKFLMNANLLGDEHNNGGKAKRQKSAAKPINQRSKSLAKLCLEENLNNATESQQKGIKFAMPKRPRSGLHECSDQAMAPKLNQAHQETESVKKSRTMSFMDFRDVPKQGQRSKTSHPRRRNRN